MSARHSRRGPLAAIDGETEWLNSKRLTEAELHGRVVLVDFCTYSCINWLRTLPYIRAWHDRYRDHGLVVLGVHSPEFGFEHDLPNVRRAMVELDVHYPVVVDNAFSIWRSFDNHYWPALYLLDGTGRVRFHHFGEESYREIERATQQLLGVHREVVVVDADGFAEPADWRSLRSPETYLGSSRSERRIPSAGGDLELNQWSLIGDWEVGEEAAVLSVAGGSIAYCFEGRDVNMVLAPPATGTHVRFTVHVDGVGAGDNHGLDIDDSGAGVVPVPRMYQLARLRGPVRPRRVDITFLDPGVRAYVFTFG